MLPQYDWFQDRRVSSACKHVQSDDPGEKTLKATCDRGFFEINIINEVNTRQHVFHCACCGVILDHTGDYQPEVNDEQLTKRHDFDPYHQDHLIPVLSI